MLLIAGLLAEGPTRVIEPVATRDHSERMLAAAGAEVGRDGDGRHDPARHGARARERSRSPGTLAAAFFIVAASIVPGSEVTLTGVGLNPTRTGLLEILGRMGAAIEIEDADVAASRAGHCDVAGTRAAGPRSAAPRCRSRSTSCRWSRSPPASPRARRRSATPRSSAQGERQDRDRRSRRWGARGRGRGDRRRAGGPGTGGLRGGRSTRTAITGSR